MHRCSLFISFLTCLSYAFSQGTLTIQVSDFEKEPYQNTLVEIVQLKEQGFTQSDGKCYFKNIPPGTYALAIDYLYDIEYRTVFMPSGDTTIYFQLERRISFDEILVKSYQLGISGFPNATILSGQILQDSYKEKDIPYVLVSAPGTLMSSDAGNGVGYTGIRFRGLDPSHIQLTLNGIPFTDAESSLSYFVDIPDILSVAENISVIRGNVPNRPGTPSFGGAIDIQTNQLKFQQGGHVKFQYGSFQTTKYNAAVHSGLIENKYFLEAGLSQQKSKGYIDRADSKLKSLFLSVGRISKKSSFRFNYIHGSEKTNQAWFGLPVQYADVDSLRTYNAAGQAKPDFPYKNEIDDYKQDHLQFFFQSQFIEKCTWNNTFNYTHGGGFYENYIGQADLSLYSIDGFGIETGDLIRQKWLDNDFFFYKSDVLVAPSKYFSWRPEISISSYKGNHFGRVKDVILDSFNKSKNLYYENQGTKVDWSAGLKFIWNPSLKFEINLDLLYRNVNHRIEGVKEFNFPLFYELNFNYFTPKLFVSHFVSNYLTLYSSAGYMQREPFREDIIIGDFKNTAEELLDFELGFRFEDQKKLSVQINAFYMHYPSLRGLSGKLNDVGEPLFLNLKGVKNWGIECSAEFLLDKGFSLSSSAAFSYSKIPDWDESFLIYSNDWSSVLQVYNKHLNAPLAYHPNVVCYSELNKKFDLGNSSENSINFQLSHQIVSDFYMDNTGRSGSKLKGYSVFHLGCSLEFKLFQKSRLELWLDVQNVFNESYFSHGWVSRFGYNGDLDLTSSPYLGKENNETYHYKGLYPQAFRHFSTGVSLTF